MKVEDEEGMNMNMMNYPRGGCQRNRLPDATYREPGAASLPCQEIQKSKNQSASRAANMIPKHTIARSWNRPYRYYFYNRLHVIAFTFSFRHFIIGTVEPNLTG